MSTNHRMSKKKILNTVGVLLGVVGFILVIYLGIMLYSRGVYVDEHHLSGYITSTEVLLGISALLFEIGCIICVNIAPKS